MSRKVNIEIAKHTLVKWQGFLFTVQTNYQNMEKVVWLHVSRIHESKSGPFSKLGAGKTILKKEEQMSEEQFGARILDVSDLHEVQKETEYIE